ncbi:hypothetical protein Tco_0412896 [Tanacetum coccineum]
MKVDDLFSKTIPTSGISELVWKTLIRRTLICKMAEQDIPPPHITAMKIPIIRKGEYDIWSMRMRKIYMSHTAINKPIGDVIVNGDLEEEPAPTEKDFCNVTDAKSLWEAIKSRFGGLVQTSASQNLAFLSSENTSSTNEVSTASGDFGVSTAGGINQVPSTSMMVEDDLEGIGSSMAGSYVDCQSKEVLVAQDGLGGYDWSNYFEVELVNYALMTISSSSSSSSSDSEIQKCSKQCLESFETLQKNYDTEREKHNKAKLEIRGYEIALESLEEIKINNLNLELEKVVKEIDELKDKIAKWEESTKNLDEILNSQMSARDKTGLGYSTQLNELSSNHEADSENSLSIFDARSSDEDNTPKNNRFSKNRYKAVPPSHLQGKTNNANTKKPKSVSESVVSNPKINRDSVIIEDWNSDDVEEVSRVQ